MTNLPQVKILPCVWPQLRNPITEDSPAVEVMTDFSHVTPVTVEPVCGLDHALDRMKTMGVRMLLVTDNHDDINGVITSYDLQSEKPLRIVRENGISY